MPDLDDPVEASDLIDPGRPPVPFDLRSSALAALSRAGVEPWRVAVGLGVACALAVVVVLAWPRAASPAPELALPRASTTVAVGGAALPAPPTTAATATTVVVDAAGRVTRPGVYRLAAGARVADVLAAAGGLAAGADRSRINLAAPVADGARVYVPAVGEEVPPIAVGAAGGSTVSGTSGVGSGEAEDPQPVNINTATLEELDTLPGVGPATAQAIIDHRAQRGPFASVDDLLDVRGIGDAKLAELRDRVTV